MIDISGIDKAELLAALVNGARPLGMGFIHDDGKAMTKEDAQEWINKGRSHDIVPFGHDHLYFDYVKAGPSKATSAAIRSKNDYMIETKAMVRRRERSRKGKTMAKNRWSLS